MNNAELYSLIRDQAERLGAMLREQQVEATKSEAILDSVADGVMVSDQRPRHRLIRRPRVSSRAVAERDQPSDLQIARVVRHRWARQLMRSIVG
jgi:hypothetical protein